MTWQVVRRLGSASGRVELLLARQDDEVPNEGGLIPRLCCARSKPPPTALRHSKRGTSWLTWSEEELEGESSMEDEMWDDEELDEEVERAALLRDDGRDDRPGQPVVQGTGVSASDATTGQATVVQGTAVPVVPVV